MKDLDKQIVRAKELLGSVRHVAMATVNQDGSPHNTPLYYVIDDTRKYTYWASSPDAQHSRNLQRTGRAFVVVYEANVGGGLYLEVQNAHEVAGDELRQGLAVWNARRVVIGRRPMTTTNFTVENPQRMYRADLVRCWINHSEKDASGNVLRDMRTEIRPEDLLGTPSAAGV